MTQSAFSGQYHFGGNRASPSFFFSFFYLPLLIFLSPSPSFYVFNAPNFLVKHAGAVVVNVQEIPHVELLLGQLGGEALQVEGRVVAGLPRVHGLARPVHELGGGRQEIDEAVRFAEGNGRRG